MVLSLAPCNLHDISWHSMRDPSGIMRLQGNLTDTKNPLKAEALAGCPIKSHRVSRPYRFAVLRRFLPHPQYQSRRGPTSTWT